MKKPTVPVAKEGMPFIAFAALLSLVLAVLQYSLLSFAALTLTAFVLYFSVIRKGLPVMMKML